MITNEKKQNMSKIFASCFEQARNKHMKYIDVDSTAELSHDEEELKKQMLHQTLGRVMIQLKKDFEHSNIELSDYTSRFRKEGNEIHMQATITIMVADDIPDTLFNALMASTKIENFNELMILVKDAMKGDLGDLGVRLEKAETIDEKLKIIREELDNE